MAMLLGVSCASARESVEEILVQLEKETAPLPAGNRYRSGVSEGEDEALLTDVRDALYGQRSEEIFALVEEYAIYLSATAMPYEIGVFRCYSSTDAHRVALMCMERIEALRVALGGTQWETVVGEAEVVCRGRDVLLCLTERSESVARKANRLLG